MYVTRPLSLYKKFPDFITEDPPEGPSSGYLVVQDDEPTTPKCLGFSKGLSVKDFPLPSNRVIRFHDYIDSEGDVLAIPVVDRPLSTNQYYLIRAQSGEAYVCSKEEDKGISCGRTYIQDRKPRPLDPEDIYQQFEFSTTPTCSKNIGFSAKSAASNGHLPKFLRSTKPQSLTQRPFKTSKHLEAHGLNSSLRAQLPDFDNFPVSRESSPTPVCVGTWLSPFVFVHEGELGGPLKEGSVYYSVSLEQRWQRIYYTEYSPSLGSSKVIVDVVVPTHVVSIYGKDAVIDEGKSDPRVTWFTPLRNSGEQMSVGLNHLVIERMVWEEKRVGWANRKEREMRVVREEEYGGIGWWAKFGCYVLVERFVVRRMDGSLVLSCDFMHTHQVRTKWE